MISVYEMVDNLRSFANEDTDIFLDNETILRVLNKGLSDVLAIIGRATEWMLNKSGTKNVVSGTYEYDFPKDVLASRVRYIKYKDGSDWVTLKEKALKNETSLSNITAGTPRYFIRFGNKFRVYPTPNTSVTNGFEILYTEKVYKFQYPMGDISKVINGTRIYLNKFDNTDKTDSIIINVNDYVSVTDNSTGRISYNFRVKSIDSVNGYIDIYTGDTGLTVSAVSQANGSFTFSGSPDLSNIIPGDVLTISGSTGNDDDYTIIGVDTDTIYVAETIPDSTGDGTAESNMPATKNELTISTSARSVGYGDYITSFMKTGASSLDDIHDDYIEQYALYKVLKKAKEDINDELEELKRKAQAVENYSSDRKTPYTTKIRQTWE